jgi:hypothetical protein
MYRAVLWGSGGRKFKSCQPDTGRGMKISGKHGRGALPITTRHGRLYRFVCLADTERELAQRG